MFKDSEKQKEIPHSSDNNNKSQENLHLSKELATKGNSPLVTKNKKLIKEYIDTKHGDEHPAIKGALTTIIETKLDNPLTIEVLRENFKEKYKQSIDYQALIEDIQSKLHKRIGPDISSKVIGISEQSIKKRIIESKNNHSRFNETKDYNEMKLAFQDLSKSVNELSDIFKQIELADRFISINRRNYEDFLFINRTVPIIQKEALGSQIYKRINGMEIDTKDIEKKNRESSRIYKDFCDTSDYKSKHTLYEEYLTIASQYKDIEENLRKSYEILKGFKDSITLEKHLSMQFDISREQFNMDGHIITEETMISNIIRASDENPNTTITKAQTLQKDLSSFLQEKEDYKKEQTLNSLLKQSRDISSTREKLPSDWGPDIFSPQNPR